MPPVVIDLRSADDSRDVVHRAVQALAEGELVAFPTETVYGLAASALDARAVERLLDTKGRAAGHALTLAIRSADDALDYVPDLSPLARRLARRCWPGPVTLVVHDEHPESAIQQLPRAVRQAVVPTGTVGLRVPAHPMILDVMRLLAGPLVLSSANQSGQPDAVTAQQVVESLGDRVALVLDDGQSRFGQPSSVVRVDDRRLEVLRAGVVPEKTLRRLASLIVLFVCTGNTCRSPMAEALCRKLLAERLGCAIDTLEDSGVIVQSAGIAAMAGGRAALEAVAAMAQRGLDLSAHESQPLTVQLMQHADVIYTMTHSHRDAILNEFPQAARVTQVLCPEGIDIADPIGGPDYVYQQCAQQIEQALAVRIAQLEL
jgi:tRNA threonylcarbamoyl adenosine modification protein (Sua5/YciO/YrdC/YwlC family)